MYFGMSSTQLAMALCLLSIILNTKYYLLQELPTKVEDEDYLQTFRGIFRREIAYKNSNVLKSTQIPLPSEVLYDNKLLFEFFQ